MRPWSVVMGLDVAAGYRLPWGWGVGYRRITRDEAVCFPIPLNLLVGASVATYWWIVSPFRGGELEEALALAERYRQRMQNADRRAEHYRDHAAKWRHACRAMNIDPDTGEPQNGDDDDPYHSIARRTVRDSPADNGDGAVRPNLSRRESD